MGKDPFELDERTKRLGRQWTQEIRAKDAAEDAALKKPARDNSGVDGDGDSDFWDWLFDTNGSDCDGGDCGGH